MIMMVDPRGVGRLIERVGRFYWAILKGGSLGFGLLILLRIFFLLGFTKKGKKRKKKGWVDPPHSHIAMSLKAPCRLSKLRKGHVICP